MTTWNAADKVGVALSGGDLIATDTGNSPTDGARSTTSSSSGKVAFSVTSASSFAAGEAAVGVSLAGAPFDASDADCYILVYVSGLGYLVANNGGTSAGPDTTSTPPTGAGDVVLTLLDSAGKLYFQCNGNNLFGADPVAGTGGLTIPTGSWFATIATNVTGATGTADFTPGSLPSGYSDWDGGGGGSPYTLTASQGTFSVTGQTAGLRVARKVVSNVGTFAITGQTAGLQLGPYWTFVGQTEAAVNASGNYTIAIPAGVQQNDVLVVDIATRSNVIFTNADFTFPQSDSGGNTTNNTTASDTSFQTGYCIRGVSNPSTTFARTGGSRALGTMRAYRSSRAGTPSFDTSAKLAMASAGTALTLTGGVTTTGIDELITTGVYGARANTVSNMYGTTEVTGASGATGTTTPPVFGTWTERSDRNNGTSPTVALAVFDVIKRTAGSTGNLTATESQSALHGMTAMAFKHPSASGSPYTLTADKGTFLITGVSAGLKRAFTNVASAGSFAINGQTVGLKKGFKVGANAGAFVLSGQSVNLKRTYVSSSSTGAFVITGQTAGLRTSLGITALLGSFSIGGQSVGLKVGRVVASNVGSYAITGQVADLIYTPVGVSYTLTADKGTFNIAGQSAGLARGLKTAFNVGNYAITGQSAVLRYGRSMGSASGTFLITGQSATLRHNTLVGFAPGAFNIVGQTANLRLGRNSPSNVGVFFINGQTAVLRKTTKMVLSPSAFDITGFSTTLLLNKNLLSAAGSYVVSGKDVTFSLGETGHFLLQADKSTYIIDGKSLDLLYGLKAGGVNLIRPHYTKVNSQLPKLPERTFDKVHPVEEIRKAAAKLSSVGGHARAAALTSKQRIQIASIAAKARWR